MTLNLARLQPTIERLGEAVGDNLQILAAERLAEQHYPQLNPDQPALIAGLSSRTWAEDVAQVLLKVYGPDYRVKVLTAENVETVTLAGLATALDWGQEAHVFVPPLPRPGSYLALQEVVARLRAPDGCPWDRELTWSKLRAFLLEETYELLAALDAENPAKVAEEQGDLFLQLALQIQIAIEEGKFRSGDVMAGIVEKLVRRHPHVFANTVVSGTDEVLANWEAIKRAERAENGDRGSLLAGIPAGLPALAQTVAYLDRVSRVREMPEPRAPWADLAGLGNEEPVTPEMVGRALFQFVAWARARGIEPENALRAENARYAASEASAVK